MVTLIIVMKLLQIIERKTSNSKKKKKSSFKKENIIGIPTYRTKKMIMTLASGMPFVWTLTKKAYHYRAANRSLIR